MSASTRILSDNGKKNYALIAWDSQATGRDDRRKAYYKKYYLENKDKWKKAYRKKKYFVELRKKRERAKQFIPRTMSAVMVERLGLLE